MPASPIRISTAKVHRIVPSVSLQRGGNGDKSFAMSREGYPDYTALGRAIAQLRAGLAHASGNPQDDLLRDGVIQRFEYTYELCWKMLKRHLEAVAPSPEEADALSFRQLIRSGSERGLLRSGLDVWAEFRRARSVTSHVYEREKALEVFALIPGFLEEADDLFHRLNAPESDR